MNKMNLFDYPYLVASLVLLTIAFAGYLFFSKHRRPLLISGLLSIPCSLATFFFVPEYWQPLRLFDFRLGIEDIVFSFSTGMMAWIIMAMRHGNSVLETDFSKVLPRYLRVVSLGIPMLLLMRQLPLMVMHQAFLGMIIMGVILSWNRWRMLPAAILTGTAFCLLYTLFVAIIFASFPGFSIQWTHLSLSGFSILGIPFEESLWAFSFGVCWVICMVFIFDAKIDPENSICSKSQGKMIEE